MKICPMCYKMIIDAWWRLILWEPLANFKLLIKNMIISLYSFILSSIHSIPLDKGLTCINTVLNSLVTTVLLLSSWIPNYSCLAALKKITTCICKILWKCMEVGGEMVENWHDLDFQVWIRLSEWRRKPVFQRSTKSRGIGAKEVLHGKSERSFSPGFVLVLRTTGDNTTKEKWSKVNRLHRNERSFHLI